MNAAALTPIGVIRRVQILLVQSGVWRESRMNVS